MIHFARFSRCWGKSFRCAFPAADLTTQGTCLFCSTSTPKKGLVRWKRNKTMVNFWCILWQEAISGAELPIWRASFDNVNNFVNYGQWYLCIRSWANIPFRLNCPYPHSAQHLSAKRNRQRRYSVTTSLFTPNWLSCPATFTYIYMSIFFFKPFLQYITMPKHIFWVPYECEKWWWCEKWCHYTVTWTSVVSETVLVLSCYLEHPLLIHKKLTVIGLIISIWDGIDNIILIASNVGNVTPVDISRAERKPFTDMATSMTSFILSRVFITLRWLAWK